MFTTADQTTVRRISSSVEVHARVTPPGRWPHVIGRDDVLLLVGREAARLSCGRRVYLVPPSLTSFVGAGDVVVVELAGPAQCRAIHLAPGLIARAADLPPDPQENGTPRRVVWLIARPGACDAADTLTNEDDLARLLHDTPPAVSRRLRLTSTPPIAHPVVARAQDHLLKSYGRRVTLDELSAVAGMRRFALAHAFTREVGLPPHAYQTHLRVERARELIAEGRPLSAVSVEVGFADQSHLTRHFKRVLGLTPGRYARAVIGEGRSVGDGRATPREVTHASASIDLHAVRPLDPVTAGAAFMGAPQRRERMVASMGAQRR